MEDDPRTSAYLVSFAAAGDYAAAAALDIAPPPARLSRVFMLFECLRGAGEAARCAAEARGELGAAVARAGGPFRRPGPGDGMAVLEWGGMRVVRAGHDGEGCVAAA
jgi:hypothetical protein